MLLLPLDAVEISWFLWILQVWMLLRKLEFWSGKSISAWVVPLIREDLGRADFSGSNQREWGELLDDWRDLSSLWDLYKASLRFSELFTG